MSEKVNSLKNKKIKKVIKIVAITLASIIIVGIAGFYIMLNCVVKPKSKEIIKAVDEIITDDEIKKAIEPYLGQERLDEILKSIDNSKTVTDHNNADSENGDNSEKDGSQKNNKESKTGSESSKNNKDAAQKNENKGNTASGNKTTGNNQISGTKTQNKNVTGNKTDTAQTPKKKRSEYSSQYDYVKDNIPSSDFSRGMALASKVDMGYISGLLAGGLTSEERSELKAYLTSHFSGSEIAEGISLYSKYSHLLR